MSNQAKQKIIKTTLHQNIELLKLNHYSDHNRMQQNKSRYRLKEHKGNVNDNIREPDWQTKRESSYQEYNIETQKTLWKKR